ncbi:MAG: hypothetical protein KJT03_24360 [Verrucomicrobiae bacterium]|nr:hypothetical protein [Verrucomicrobiae bacterium]
MPNPVICATSCFLPFFTIKALSMVCKSIRALASSCEPGAGG